MNQELLEIVNETTILGLIISNDLTWKKNTEYLVQKANKRMIIIRNLIQFPIPRKDLVLIYCQYIRVILESNCVVWFASITDEESEDLDRIQKNACKLILGTEYTHYENALEKLGLEHLKERRHKLAKKFAKGCLKIDEMKDLFPKSNESEYNLRENEKYDVKFASTARLFNSAVPTLQRMLNK